MLQPAPSDDTAPLATRRGGFVVADFGTHEPVLVLTVEDVDRVVTLLLEALCVFHVDTDDLGWDEGLTR